MGRKWLEKVMGKGNVTFTYLVERALGHFRYRFARCFCCFCGKKGEEEERMGLLVRWLGGVG